jgi:hypothetical protein
VSATPVIGLEHVEIIRELLAVGVGKETNVFSSRTPSLIHSLELSGGYQNIATLTGGDIEKKRLDGPNKGGDVDNFIIQLGLEL